MSIPGLTAWLDSPQGRYITGWERERLDALVSDIFGFRALQFGLPQVDFLRANRMALRCQAGEYAPTQLHCQLDALPLASQSVDLVVLPHVLEFHRDPHQVLREIERVLIPEGQLIVLGFNPLSLWGLRSRLRRNTQFPWQGNYLSVLRLKDWLKLLGLEPERSEFGCFAPPFSGGQWLQRCHALEQCGTWLGFSGAVYILRAIKRTPAMRLVIPGWRYRKLRGKALRPVAQKEIHGST